MRFAWVLLIAACGGAPSGAADGVDGKVDSAASTSTYYQIAVDQRRCASPNCGGYWASRVNFATTKCRGGSTASSCYVAELDLSPLGIDALPAAASDLLVRGSIVSKTYASGAKLGVLKVSEVWAAATSNGATGTYYRVNDRGLRCWAPPCPTYHEAKLNSSSASDIQGVDFSAVGADDAQLDDAYMTIGTGILVAGTSASGVLDATQFWLPVQ